MASRRSTLRYIGGGLAAGATGCLGLLAEPTPAELSVINNRESVEIVRLELSRLDDTTLVAQRIEARPTVVDDRTDTFVPSVTVSRTVTQGETYGLHVSVEGGSETTTRVSADCPATEGGQQWAARLTDEDAILIHDDC